MWHGAHLDDLDLSAVFQVKAAIFATNGTKMPSSLATTMQNFFRRLGLRCAGNN
jgi:hypothetical protein